MKKFLFAISLLAAVPAMAEVRLVVDDHIKVTAINGEAINQSSFRPLQQEFKLGAGTSVITAKYERLYDINRDDHDVVRSKDITISAVLNDNQTYRLTMPNAPERHSDAKEYAKAPKLAILSGSTVISEQAAQVSHSGGLFSSLGTMFGRGDSVAANQRAVIAAAQAPQPTQAPVQPRPNATTLDKFMELWLNASEEERQKIRQWVQK